MELTPDEAALVADARTLMDKTRATAKIKAHLEALKGALFPLVQAGSTSWRVPDGFDPAASQIARGENLEGTPYQYLDFPKYFSKETYFTFRTLIWWGRSVSYCWILKGPDLSHHRSALIQNISSEPNDFGVWFGGDPWDWEGFVPLSSVPSEALEPMQFLKVGRRVDIQPEGFTRDMLVEGGIRAFNSLTPLVEGP